MSFNRAYEFERSDFGPTESNELQDSFEKNLSKKSTTGTGVSQIQSSLTRVNYMNPQKTTVAEMVADLIERTGLEAYQKEIQATEQKEKTTKKVATKVDVKEITMDGVSLLDVPGVSDAITGYIKRYNAFQLEPVLNFIMEEIVPTLTENNDGSLGEIEHVNEILGKDYHSEDPRLKIFITENLLNGQNKSLKDFTGHNTPVRMDDGVFDILTPSSKY